MFTNRPPLLGRIGDEHLMEKEDRVYEDDADWLYSPHSSENDLDEEEEPDMATIAKHKQLNPKVVINIGGLKHEVLLGMGNYYKLAF